MEITLYTTHCPRCTVIEKKLQMAGLEYTVNDNPAAIMALGFKTAPILMVDDEIYQFKQASDWLSDYKKKINIQPDPVKFECN